MKIGKFLCWIGLHNRRGWETDYSRPYVSGLGAFFPSGPIAKMKAYREFNRCERCGDVDCRFTRLQ